MIGKVLKVNDYKFVYGQDTVYINAYGVFKHKKSGNRYIIYSYDNKKLYYGSAFIKGNNIVIMTSKDDTVEIINKFIKEIMDNNLSDDFEVQSLDNIIGVEIIDQHEISEPIDIIKLNDMTIPKPKVEIKDDSPKKKKKISIPIIVMLLLIVAALAFVFINPELIKGKNEKYTCTKSYLHDEIPATVTDYVNLLFNSKKSIISINITSDYLFSDHDYYAEFKDKSYFYQYINSGDTYKFDDDNYTYKLFSKIDTEVDYFMPRDLDKLISYYQDKGYTCNLVKESE